MRKMCLPYLRRRELIFTAINESILNKIDDLKIKKQEKQLLKDILAQQEHGSKQYSKQYTAIINDYLEKKKK